MNNNSIIDVEHTQIKEIFNRFKYIRIVEISIMMNDAKILS